MKLVNLDQAETLAYLGFNEECLFSQYMRSPGMELKDSMQYPEIDDIILHKNTDNCDTSIPDYDLVFEWFRNKGFMVSINYDKSGYYTYSIYVMSEDMKVSDDTKFDTYEKLEDFLIDKLLDLYEEVNQK